MEKFKAYKLTEVDRKIRAEFVECTLDELDAGELVVRVAYSDVNYKDALAATGKGRILLRPACIGGIDLAGTVVSSADGRFAKGDAVLAVGHLLGVKHHGGYAEYARIPADWAVKLPRGMTLWEAMAFGTAGYTAGLAVMRMEHNGLKPANGPVVVDGATGGVGSIALAALAKLGYAVTAMTGKESEAGWLKQLGAKEILLRQSLDLTKIKPLDKATWAGAVAAPPASPTRRPGLASSLSALTRVDICAIKPITSLALPVTLMGFWIWLVSMSVVCAVSTAPPGAFMKPP